jgi:hypothetical protein
VCKARISLEQRLKHITNKFGSIYIDFIPFLPKNAQRGRMAASRAKWAPHLRSTLSLLEMVYAQCRTMRTEVEGRAARFVPEAEGQDKQVALAQQRLLSSHLSRGLSL